MNKKSEDSEERPSLIPIITGIAKLLRVQVKENEIKVRKTTSISPPFVKGVEQIVRLLRIQARIAQRGKKRSWKVVKKSPAKFGKKKIENNQTEA